MEKLNGWLTPMGNYIDIPDIEEACKSYFKLEAVPERSKEYRYLDDFCVQALGWIWLTYSEEVECQMLVSCKDNKPTEKQKEWLKPYAAKLHWDTSTLKFFKKWGMDCRLSPQSAFR